MIVATRTIHCEPEKRAAGGGYDFIQSRGAYVFLRHHILITNIIIRPSNQKGAADFYLGISLSKLVSSKVFCDEAIKRLILIKRTNDVVAKRPKVVNDKIPLEPITLAETHYIQPVPAPMFAVLGRGKESIHQRFHGRASLNLIRLCESLHLFHSRRQPSQIITHATNERPRTGRCVEM